ncbi:MAG: 30S ribosomal protein S16 [Candidatus Paceibacterota bacterium]|jgi:ribosomal protein S16|nr:30S ribosomal protein S16 [Candidatus Paceibacterota bacterium]MDD3548368.1 30S ribosomal protein S16 [Candidatus Paceibacterota bacterium]MDD4998872.1 30S ribosomal protein S16 [Candidatus Paceibacterota bacterium]MDD5545106.1 30S ribosomal protein S16 [Candidatus Paceibacterota bacterium]
MLILRFQRKGKKRDSIFRVVAVDSRMAVTKGTPKEILGWWDPRKNKFDLNKERILYWLSQGARQSDSCHNLLVKAGIIKDKKIAINLRKKKNKKEGEEQIKEIKTQEPAEEKIETGEELLKETESELISEEKKEEQQKEETKIGE